MNSIPCLHDNKLIITNNITTIVGENGNITQVHNPGNKITFLTHNINTSETFIYYHDIQEVLRYNNKSIRDIFSTPPAIEDILTSHLSNAKELQPFDLETQNIFQQVVEPGV